MNEKEKEQIDEEINQQDHQVTEESESVENKIEVQDPSELISEDDKFNELNDKYLRLYSEFDNYRRRTAREKLDLISTAGEAVINSVIPVVDDFERAIENNDKIDDINAVRDGVKLIHQKFKKILLDKGLKEMDMGDMGFNPDYHEAITKIPAPSPEQKGKIVDVIEKGYMLHEKVIRFAKVVVGE